MSTRVIFEKSIREMLRDRVGLALTLLTAPFFVVFYALVFQSSDMAPQVAITPENTELSRLLGAEFELVRSDDVEEDLRRGRIDIGVVEEGNTYRLVGDGTSATFIATLPAIQAIVHGYEATRRGQLPIVVEVDTMGLSGSRSLFDLYVPNLLVFALIMLVFSSSLSIAREAERGTLDRLRTTLLKPGQFLLGVTAAQLALGIASVGLTFAVALAFGFESAGSPVLILAIATTTGLACVSMGVLVAGAARNVLQAFLMSSVFMFLLVLFSGLVFPMPELALLDVLPTVHAVRALADVLNLGAGFEQIAPSLGKLVALSLTFFGLGWARFSQLNRTQIARHA